MIANDNVLPRASLASRHAAVERVLDDILRHDVDLAAAVKRNGAAGARDVLTELSRDLVHRLRVALGLPANDNELRPAND